MALAANKALAKAVVAAAGVDVPRSQLLRDGDAVMLRPPYVVKPNTSDNSEGVALVREPSARDEALRDAFRSSDEVLVEAYVPLGREVRCGVVERDGTLRCLPLEEYFVDSETRPIRRKIDKLKRDERGELTLAAKTRAESWIVADDDPIVPVVHAAALRCYRALGSRHYNLFDFRIDPAGNPWFLEAGPYCSFSPKSVVVTMMAAAGISLQRFFAEATADVLAASRGATSTAHDPHRFSNGRTSS
jgi:D-alanine-D-alanine ligase